MSAGILSKREVRMGIAALVLVSVLAWVRYVFKSTQELGIPDPPLALSLVLLGAGMSIFCLVAWNFIKSAEDIKRNNPPSDDFAVRVVLEIAAVKLKAWPRAFLKVISGEGHTNVYTPRLLNILRENKDYIGGAIEVIVGPIILLHQDNTRALPPIIYMAREGLIKAFIALKRQPQHFIAAISGTSYIENPHLPKADLRNGVKRKNVLWRVRQLHSQFNKKVHDPSLVVPYSEKVLATRVIFMTNEQMERLIGKLRESLGASTSQKKIIKKFDSMEVNELKLLAGQSGVDYYELKDLDSTADWRVDESLEKAA